MAAHLLRRAPDDGPVRLYVCTVDDCPYWVGLGPDGFSTGHGPIPGITHGTRDHFEHDPTVTVEVEP